MLPCRRAFIRHDAATIYDADVSLLPLLLMLIRGHATPFRRYHAFISILLHMPCRSYDVTPLPAMMLLLMPRLRRLFRYATF